MRAAAACVANTRIRVEGMKAATSAPDGCKHRLRKAAVEVLKLQVWKCVVATAAFVSCIQLLSCATINSSVCAPAAAEVGLRQHAVP